MTSYSSQPDGTAGIDVYLQENAADTANGTNNVVNARPNAGSRMISLLKFDLSSIPGGSSISAATLTVWSAVTQPASAMTLEVRRVLAANAGWDESSTWNYKTPSTVRWAGDAASNGGTDAGCSISGTDYSATLMGSSSVASGEAAATQHVMTLNTTEMAAMLAANNGFVLLANGGSGTYQFRSSDHTTSAERPKLDITYTAGGTARTRTFRDFSTRASRQFQEGRMRA